jgi:hypothetical protein
MRHFGGKIPFISRDEREIPFEMRIRCGLKRLQTSNHKPEEGRR